MLKKNLRATVKNLIKQIDKTATVHDTLIDHVLEECINSVYYEIHAQTPKALGQYTKRFQAQYLSLGVAGRYAYALTVKLVPLPDKRGGVRSIVATEDTDLYFIPVTDQELLMMPESVSDGLVTTSPVVAYYVVRPDIVEFYGLDAARLYYAYIFDLLVAFTSLADTDDVPLPYGKNADIVKMALELLGVIPPKDLLDNNSDLK